MSVHTIISSTRLSDGLILAPERYDPRRQELHRYSHTVGDLADVVSDLVNPTRAEPSRHVAVFNTSDAREGLLVARPTPEPIESVGSTKKRIQAGDVIISRLRPYLRQVAFVDPELTKEVYSELDLLCSTEFFVLRSRTPDSIGFLAPFLLSASVQAVLAASQEGGHHPRFNTDVLERLGIPEELVLGKESLSDAVASAARSFRTAEVNMRELINACDETLA